MSAYTPGQVLYVKSTEEPVTVVGTRAVSEDDFATHKFPREYQGSGVIIIARRPVISEANGVRYAFFDFLEEELETDQGSSQRLYDRIKFREALAMKELESNNTPTGAAVASRLVKPN